MPPNLLTQVTGPPRNACWRDVDRIQLRGDPRECRLKPTVANGGAASWKYGDATRAGGGCGKRRRWTPETSSARHWELMRQGSFDPVLPRGRRAQTSRQANPGSSPRLLG